VSLDLRKLPSLFFTTPTNSFFYSSVARLASGTVAISIYTSILTNVQSLHAAMLVPAAAITASPVCKGAAGGIAARLGCAGEDARHYGRDCSCSGESVLAELCNWVTHDGAEFVEFGIIGIIGELKFLDFFSLLPCVRSCLENEIF
jgi:hypothetical protein